jgi:hypothetical protein
MTYERLDEVIGRLKSTRDTQNAAEGKKVQAALQAATEFARIKARVISPVFIEITAHLAAQGFSGDILDRVNDPTGPISLIVDFSDENHNSQKESISIVFDQEKGMCGFHRSRGYARDIQTNIMGNLYEVGEISGDLVHEKVEEFIETLVGEEMAKNRR